MWNQQAQAQAQAQSLSGEVKKDGVVAVAIDRDKGSQFALKWAVDNVLSKGQTVTLLHVKLKQSTNASQSSPSIVFSSVNNEDVTRSVKSYGETQAREIFLPFRCFCSRKDVKCHEVILEDNDISRALIDYCNLNAIEVMVVSPSTKNGLLRRFKGPDVATNLIKGCPEFCTVYLISKGKMVSVRSATRPAPILNSRSPKASSPNVRSANNSPSFRTSGAGASRDRERSPFNPERFYEELETNTIRSPFTRGRAANGRAYGEIGMPESDISFVGSSWQNNERISADLPSYERTSLDIMDYGHGYRMSGASDSDRLSIGSAPERRSLDQNALVDYSGPTHSGFSSSSNTEDFETEMRRLRQELKQTMEMYNAACKEAILAKQKASELQRTKLEEDHRLEQARSSEEAARAVADQERARTKAAIEAAEAAQKIAELEAQKRIHAEKKANSEAEDKKRALLALNYNDNRYRRYTIEEIEIATNNFSSALKIGEGGYGPVYKCTLDHTLVAIKVLRPDAAQGESQFQQEVEILSCIRHPNMVLLLGACPEYGCLVYEYMSNGSLEDCLFNRGNAPPLPWQLRFRIAAEIGTSLLFLHQTKPEPLVHRDLKPANILLDRNYVSKIADVGLARLVPPSVADTVTQYRMTQAAGTFCYIDPEYQQSGMLGTKSDVYSLGILYLQLITAKPAMGLTHHVQRAIERGTFEDMLDPSIQDWPYEEALEFAKLSLKCAELRRKDRPDLTQILPELNRLREFGDDNTPTFMLSPIHPSMYRQNQYTTNRFSQDVISESTSRSSELSSGRSPRSSPYLSEVS
ncbi:U-box domain-containing protein 52-like [Amaranthus tricolor]|uniref:U-box domain-containing protein 52-like n=1 Tax=Amaranthus tricolor TaxID=29722 RepID=UPI00258476A2|nr:U-box domain-containing protein 52-like [Amaranthus tricolor]